MLISAIARGARPISGSVKDLDALLDLTRDARLVLIGEATHGTHEFYRLRAELTKRLIQEQEFVAVAAEADWPDAYRVNRYVRAVGFDADAEEALRDFRRFPAWMWRNTDVLDFVGWLRAHNDRLSPRAKTGFYGLDVYSLHASIAAVLAYLDKTDPAAAERARDRYYRPQTERLSHYYHVTLRRQFDAIIHIDRTRALEPLERTASWAAGEAPETFPTGL